MPRPLRREGYCPRTGRGQPVTPRYPELGSEYPRQASGGGGGHGEQKVWLLSNSAFPARSGLLMQAISVCL